MSDEGALRGRRKGFVFVQTPLPVMEDLKPAPLAIFQWIVHFANAEQRCWPGQALLVERAHVSESSVRRYIAELIERGYLHVTRRGQGRSNLYEWDFPDDVWERMGRRQPELIDPDEGPGLTGQFDRSQPEVKTGQIDRSKAVNLTGPIRELDSEELDTHLTTFGERAHVPEGAPPASPVSATSPLQTSTDAGKGKRGSSRAPRSRASAVEVQAVFDGYALATSTTGKPRNVALTDDRRKWIAKWLADFSVDDLVEAAHGAMLDPWHNGEKDGLKRLGLKQVLRDTDTIERLRDLHREGGPARVVAESGAQAMVKRLEKRMASLPVQEGPGPMGEARACAAMIHLVRQWARSRWYEGEEDAYVTAFARQETVKDAIESLAAEGSEWPPQPGQVVARVRNPVKVQTDTGDPDTAVARDAIQRYRNTGEVGFLQEALYDADEANTALIRAVLVEHGAAAA